MIFEDQTLLRAAKIVCEQRKRDLKKVEDFCYRQLHSDDYCEEERLAMDEPLKQKMFFASYERKHLQNDPWDFIESTYKAMEKRRDRRHYLRWLADDCSRRANPFQFSNWKDQRAYGIITFWDGTKDLFYITEDTVQLPWVYDYEWYTSQEIHFLVSRKSYPLYAFIKEDGTGLDCQLSFKKGSVKDFIPFTERQAQAFYAALQGSLHVAVLDNQPIPNGTRCNRLVSTVYKENIMSLYKHYCDYSVEECPNEDHTEWCITVPSSYPQQ